jgi:hypothetical protein
MCDFFTLMHYFNTIYSHKFDKLNTKDPSATSTAQEALHKFPVPHDRGGAATRALQAMALVPCYSSPPTPQPHPTPHTQKTSFQRPVNYRSQYSWLMAGSYPCFALIKFGAIRSFNRQNARDHRHLHFFLYEISSTQE